MSANYTVCILTSTGKVFRKFICNAESAEQAAAYYDDRKPEDGSVSATLMIPDSTITASELSARQAKIAEIVALETQLETKRAELAAL